MARKNGFILRWGFCLILIIMTLSFAVWGAEQQPQTGFDAKLVSNFEIFDANIRDTFRGLAEYGGFNLLMDKKVQGNVTTKFQAGVNIRDAVDILAKTNGYSCYWMSEQRTVVIGDDTTFKNLDTMYTRVYNLKYADPEAVAETLKVIIPKDRLGIDKRTNQLVVRGNLLEQENVHDAVAGLDREMPQISIEMRIEETTRTALDELGVGWGKDNFSLGFNKPELKFTKLLANFDSLSLRFWEEKTQAQILARPMVSTTDSKEAMIFIGDKVPLIKKEVSDSGKSSYSVEFIDVGTKLVVTPRINADNIVTVNVKAMLSNVSKTVAVGSNNEYPVPYVRNREASSVIRLRDGETFMLSGLNQNESSLTKKGLKGFQKIPLIGGLFKSTSKEDPKNGTEIVIFVTPRIIHTESQEAPVSEQPKKVESETSALATSDGAVKAPLQQANDKTAVAAGKPAAAQQPVTPTPVVGVATKVTEQPPVAQASVVSEKAKNPAQQSNVTDNKPVAGQSPITQRKFDGQHLAIIVKPHQTVAQIATLYGVPAEGILKDNSLTEKTKLQPGQELVISIPADHIYRMATKETLWRISKRYGVSLDVLKEINQLEDVTKVNSWQAIILPVSVNAIMASNF